MMQKSLKISDDACIYCQRRSLRKMNKDDFSDYYKLRHGYFPYIFEYLRCGKCGKTQLKTICNKT